MEPDKPRQTPAPPPPTINDARIAAERNDTLRNRKGRDSTFVSNAAGRSGGSTTMKALMGQGG